MKENYNINVNLQCVTCGGQNFDFNEGKTYVKCLTCNREYLNGYKELLNLNQENIDDAITSTKEELIKDMKQDIIKAFRGNKYLKIR